MKKCVCTVICFINICMLLFTGCNAKHDINELYAITDNEDFTYDYVVTDKNGHVLISDKGIAREPEVNVINEDLLSISVQTGTGLSTRWTVYCDVSSGTVSDPYYSVLGEYAQNVVFVNYDGGTYRVAVQNIFSQQPHKEIILEDAAKVPDPVVAFEKSDDGKANVAYLKGDGHAETEIMIEVY